MDYIAGYSKLSLRLLSTLGLSKCLVALANDVTARNMQNDVKSKGLPWSAAKGFDTFTPIG